MEQDAKSVALRLVLTKKRTEKEVTDILIKKGFSEEDAFSAAAYYKQNGYIDHADYAKRFVHDAAFIKGYGPHRIKQALKERGVEDALIDSALLNIEFDLVSPMEKRFGSGCRSEKERFKIFNYFYRKGFASDAIKKAMDVLFENE